MNNPNKMILIAATIALVAMPSLASANCGAEHAEAKHADAKVAAQKSIVEIAQSGGFDTLVAAVVAADLVDALNGEGPLTVFAPTDEAFAKLPAGTVEALLKDPEALRKILLYHVVGGKVEAKDVMKLKSAGTLNGQNVTIDTTKGVKINDAMVVKADIAASNGVIHVIDTVLIPADM